MIVFQVALYVVSFIVNIAFWLNYKYSIEKITTERPIMIAHLVEFLLQVTLAIIYWVAIGNAQKIDIDMLQYAGDNDCSDASLQHAFNMYFTEYSYNMHVLKMGFFFLVVSMIFDHLSLLLMGPCRERLGRKISCFDKPHFLERILLSFKDWLEGKTGKTYNPSIQESLIGHP